VHPIEHLRYLARSGHVDAPDLVIETAMALRGLGSDPATVLLTCRRLVERHPTVGPLWWLCSEMVAALEPREAMRRCVEQIREDSTAVHLAEFLTERLGAHSLVCVNGWSWDVAVAFGQMEPREICVVDGDNGADHMVRILERAEHEVHLVEASGGAAAALEADLVILSAMAASPEVAWCAAGSHALAAVAYCAEIPVVLSMPRGVCLPDATLQGMRDDLDSRTRGRTWHRGIDEIPVGLFTWFAGPNGVESSSSPGFKGVVAETRHAPELLVRSAM
jgi:hypothetical protein